MRNDNSRLEMLNKEPFNLCSSADIIAMSKSVTLRGIGRMCNTHGTDEKYATHNELESENLN